MKVVFEMDVSDGVLKAIHRQVGKGRRRLATRDEVLAWVFDRLEGDFEELLMADGGADRETGGDHG